MFRKIKWIEYFSMLFNTFKRSKSKVGANLTHISLLFLNVDSNTRSAVIVAIIEMCAATFNGNTLLQYFSE
jgi:hypothetical protein